MIILMMYNCIIKMIMLWLNSGAMASMASTSLNILTSTLKIAQPSEWLKKAGLVGPCNRVRNEARSGVLTSRRGRNSDHVCQFDRIILILPTVSGGRTSGAGVMKIAR